MKTLIICIFLTAIVQAQSGGSFEIPQSVIANGGGAFTGDTFSITATNAQPLAGTVSSGGTFSARGGFWQSFLTPTAAMVGVSGRAVTEDNVGVSKAIVELTTNTGAIRYALTNPFGNFRFDDVEVGHTYILTISHKRYLFGNGTQAVLVNDEVTDILFVAMPQ